MARLFALASLVVGGVIVADILIHPEGTKQASDGVAAILRPSFNALLGQPSQ